MLQAEYLCSFCNSPTYPELFTALFSDNAGKEPCPLQVSTYNLMPDWILFNPEQETDYINPRDFDISPDDGIPDAYRFTPSYIETALVDADCDEAHQTTNLYDSQTGVTIAFSARRGNLDNKLRALDHFTFKLDKGELQFWLTVALQNCYGFCNDADTLVLARVNVLMAMEEAHRRIIGTPLTDAQRLAYAEIIADNFWLMDGETLTHPLTNERCYIKDYSNPFEPMRVLFGNNARSSFIPSEVC